MAKDPNEIINIEELMRRVKHLEEVIGVAITEDEPAFAQVDDILDTEEYPEVVITTRAYLKMASHAIEYANYTIDRSKWVEVIGMLTGKIEQEGTPLERILVNDYWPIATGDSVTVNIMEAEPVMEVFTKKPEDEFIVGWCHSHPSYTPFLSDKDIATHARYQSLWDKSVAIVVDPEMINRQEQGLGVFRLNPDFRSYYEMRYDIDGMSSAASYEALEVIKQQLFG